MQIYTEYFIARLLINLVAMIVLMKYIYYPTYQKWDNLFPFLVLNFLVFLLSYMMFKMKAFDSGLSSFGGGIGLLAAFTLLRFRTETITIKDMTYLFVILSIGVINSVMNSSYLGIAALNALILLVVFVADGDKLIKNQKSKIIEFNSLENIKPQDHVKMISQLKEVTGLNIKKISIETIDIKKQTAKIRIYYF